MQFIPVCEATSRIPGRDANAQNETIVFKANLPALGFNTYFFEKKTHEESRENLLITHNDECVLQNQVNYVDSEIRNMFLF